MGRIKVLHVLGALNRGGAELRTIEMIENSNKEKFEFHICTISTQIGNLEKKIKKAGIKIHRIKKDSLFIKNFIKLLRKENYQVVHSHLYYFSGLIMYLSFKSKTPKRISHFRTTSTRIENTTVINKIKYAILKQMVLRYSTDIIGVSNSVINSLFGRRVKSNKKVHMIYNGFDVKDFKIKKNRETVLRNLNISNDSDVYLHIGSFSEAKNHKKLLGVFKEIVELNSKAHLIIVGSGDQVIETRIHDYINVAKLRDKVTLTGQLSHVFDVLNAADLIIFPSKWEGLPGVLVEASIMKKPILTSDIPPCEELSVFFPNIYVYDLENSDYNWALKAERYLRKYKDNNMEFVELSDTPFQLEKTVKQIEKIWNNK